MNQTIGKIALGVALVALIIGGLAYTKPAQRLATQFGAIPAVNAPAANTVLPNGILLPNPSNTDYAVSRVYQYIDGALGLGDGTSVPVNEQAVRQSSLTAATTTPCNIQSPFTTATSTFEAWMNVTVATSATESIQIGVSTVPNAFTTVVSSGVSLASGAQGTIGVDTIASTTGQIITVAPAGWVSIGSSNSTALTYGGSCSGVFTSIQ